MHQELSIVYGGLVRGGCRRVVKRKIPGEVGLYLDCEDRVVHFADRYTAARVR